jgi:ArsR family transcriptional regulator
MLKYSLADAEARAPGSENAGRLAGLARQFRVLSDPTRLSIFDMLMQGVQCNCEIANRLNLSLSLISHHLRVLRQSGLVQSRRDLEDARWIYYSINREALSRLAGETTHLLDADRIQPRLPVCGPGAVKTAEK